MAQQIIDVGTVANDRTGDPWRDAFIKVNANDTELYDLQGQNNVVYLRSEADLPNQTATTWTMDENVPYKVVANFTTSLQTIWASGASLFGDNLSSFVMSFSGAGAMFLATDADVFIHDIAVDPGITNKCFVCDDTVGGLRRFVATNVLVVNTAVWGEFTNLNIVQLSSTGSFNANVGLRMFGTQGIALSISQLGLFSASPTFVGVDLGTSIMPIVEIINMINSAPSGGVGISGLVNSGNIPSGNLAMVTNCEFLGAMTDLQNITTDDLRWSFRDNSPTSDTQPDALISFGSNATETVITASSTDGSNAVLVAGTWVETEASHFSTTAAGRITYLADRGIKAPVDISVGLISAGGGAITVKVYLFADGSVVTASGIDAVISGSIAQNLSIPWQIRFSTTTYIEIFVENQTNTTNIIVDHAILRVL